jgi:outer membrane protein insertion porin family
MDPTLPASKHNPISTPTPIWIVGLIAVSLIITGCQTGQFANQNIPVPPPVLDVDSLDNVRLQSPQKPGFADARNKVRSLQDQTVFPSESRTNSAITTAKQRDPSQLVADFIINGNKILPTHHLMRNVRTRPGRYFDPDILQQDVDQLWRLPEISRVQGPYLERTPDGVIVTVDVVERNVIREVKFVGNRGVTDRALKKELELTDGDPLDVHEIRMAKNKIEELYKEKGYPRTQVEILEGNEVGDANVVFLIHEDEKQRVWKVDFEGNEIATDARLRHFIKSKPGILKIFGGLVKRDALDQDVLRLTTYYRSLGYFNARIGREVNESNDGRWMNVRFIINEGPRYRIRNVSFIGNQAYAQEQLLGMLDLKPNSEESSPEFNVAKMNSDVVTLRDLYGSEGFVFAKVDAEPRFLEEPGLLDIVYKIDEGKQYVVGNVNVHFQGDYGITKREVVLNRLSVRPGDLINVQEIRNSERRLGSAQIFAGAGASGQPPPKIVIRPPELKALERHANNSDSMIR